MTSIKSTRGMTLIELVIAFAILSVIVIVFLSLFTGSLIWILGAGDKGEALNLSQNDVESRIGREEAIDSLDLELVFNGQSYTINGGLINSNEQIGEKILKSRLLYRSCLLYKLIRHISLKDFRSPYPLLLLESQM